MFSAVDLDHDVAQVLDELRPLGDGMELELECDAGGGNADGDASLVDDV